MAEQLKGLIGLSTLALLLVMVSCGLAAFACVGRALWGDAVEKVRARLASGWWRDVRLGGMHALVIFAMALVSRGRPVLFVPVLLWLGVVLACLWMALPGLVLCMGERLSPRWVPLAGAFCLVWSCAFPYLGQALLVVLLLGTYGAGLGVLLESRRSQTPG